MTALMDAVATATAAVPRLYPLNSVPQAPTYPYGVFSASLGRGDAYTANEAHGLRHGEVVIQAFGKTADGALEVLEAAIGALLDVRLLGSTPLKAALDAPSVNRDPNDNGVVTATMPLTFAKEA